MQIFLKGQNPEQHEEHLEQREIIKYWNSIIQVQYFCKFIVLSQNMILLSD